MPITFQCPACYAMLKVPDDTVGKQAKCPRCGQIVTISAGAPAAPSSDMGAAVPPPIGGEPPRPQEPTSVNPYAPPQAQTSYLAPIDRGTIEPQIISFSETFNVTWRLFFDNIGPFLGMGALLFGLTFVGNMFVNFISLFFAAAGDDEAMIFLGIIVLIFSVLMAAVSMWLQGGMLRYSVELAKGMRPNFGRIFLPVNQFLGYFAVVILLSLIVTAGFILLILPGIILMLMLFCAPAVYLDGKAGVIESFSVSRTITRGNRLTIFGLVLVNTILAFLATVLTCGLAGILAPAFFSLLTAVIYTRSAGLFASARPPMAQMPPPSWMPGPSPGLR